MLGWFARLRDKYYIGCIVGGSQESSSGERDIFLAASSYGKLPLLALVELAPLHWLNDVGW